MSSIIECLRADMASLRRMGLIDDAVLREFEAACLLAEQESKQGVKTDDEPV